MPSSRLTLVSPERLLKFLRNPRSYPGRPAHVRLLQTHASWLVLTARRVYKVKKPVNFGFLDFSTLEKRHHFCEREVFLNRRLCAGVYLGVLPISLKKGRLVFEPGEETVEYAVEMQRLPARHFMLERLARGKVGNGDVDAIVATLARFYEGHEPTPKITAWGRVAKLKISTDENFRQTEAFIGATITLPAFESIRHFTNAFYRREAPLFAARVSQRRIRDCHGDLHLEHIHLSPGRLTIYDCIEFNDRFRYIDAASDAAFLAMDLDYRDRPDLARHFVLRLSAALRDPGLLRLLDFYKCYRAYVRGKVESFHAVARGVPQPERRDAKARAELYFRLALRYAVCGSDPTVLIVMGRAGSGKSTLGRTLAHELGLEVFSSDRSRKELAGVPLYARGTATERRRLYSPTMTARTYAALTKRALQEVRQQKSVIIDATFSQRSQRDRVWRLLRRSGARICFIEAQASRDVLRRRLAARVDARAEISDARLEDIPALNRNYQSPAEVNPRSHIRVGTTGPMEAVVGAALRALVRRRLGPDAE